MKSFFCRIFFRGACSYLPEIANVTKKYINFISDCLTYHGAASDVEIWPLMEHEHVCIKNQTSLPVISLQIEILVLLFLTAYASKQKNQVLCHGLLWCEKMHLQKIVAQRFYLVVFYSLILKTLFTVHVKMQRSPFSSSWNRL